MKKTYKKDEQIVHDGRVYYFDRLASDGVPFVKLAPPTVLKRGAAFKLEGWGEPLPEPTLREQVAYGRAPFDVGGKVIAPCGIGYFAGMGPDNTLRVQTRKNAEKGAVLGFHRTEVKPFFTPVSYYGDSVDTPKGQGYILDILHPNQLFSTALYILSRKQTKLTRPTKTWGDHALCKAYSYFVWCPLTPTQVHWFGQWQILGAIEPKDPLPQEFNSFFNLLGVALPQTPGEEPNTEPDPEEDEPEDLNDLHIPGLTQGVPVQ